MNEKEMVGLFSWTLGMWGTQEYADEAGMSLEEYWQQIIQACYLDQNDPIACWRAAFAENMRVRSVLNSMPIGLLHITGSDVDLCLAMGKKRRWVGGSGRNIPSYEIFVSPDCRGAEGYVDFSEPLYYNGTRIEGIHLELNEGRVVKATAKTNEAVLLAMLETPNADRLGEFSLTDGRYSHITRSMANTLFDENRGGPNGNMHLACGMAYADTYDGDPRVLTPAEWSDLGFNDLNCAVHTDIITTSPRTVVATLLDGREVTIYNNGQFTI
jgi:aminopeptidase